MTLNGVFVHCYCESHRCQGKLKTWRTHRAHAAQDAANRPQYPVPDEVENNQSNDCKEQEQVPVSNEHLQPYHEVPIEDIVSHIDVLQNVNEPVFETVPLCIPQHHHHNAFIMRDWCTAPW